MSDVKSKNLYELLGNTSDQDSDREPDPPTKAVDKSAPRLGKRDAPKPAPAPVPADPVSAGAGTDAARGGRGGRRGGGFSGSEAAFRDRATGRTYNRDQPTAEGEGYGRPGREQGPGAGRPSGRGPRGPRRGGDRHSRTGIGEHQKQADQGWGQSTGEGELADEKAGEAIATEEIKEGGPPAEVNADAVASAPEPEAEPEPQDNSKSFADYVAEKAAKKSDGLGLKEARAPNEGAKDNKKWKNAKELTKNDDEDTYFQGDAKQKRERERKGAKEFVEIDYSFKEQPRDARGGRGGPRGGGRGRGDRAERGDRPDRGDYRGRGRGDFAARGAPRGEFRGRGRGRGTDGPTVAVNDESAFPSLGSK